MFLWERVIFTPHEDIIDDPVLLATQRQNEATLGIHKREDERKRDCYHNS